MIVRLCKKSSAARGPAVADRPFDRANELEYQSAILAKQALKLAAGACRKPGVPKWMSGEIDKDLEKDLTAKIDDIEDKRQAFNDQQQKAMEQLFGEHHIRHGVRQPDLSPLA